jgi:hypothetical protein
MSTLRCTNLQDTSGGNSLTTAQIYNGAAKAWVKFAASSGTPSISAQFNVSSITDNGTGDFTVNFTTAMVDANYTCIGSWANPTYLEYAVNFFDFPNGNYTAPSASSFRATYFGQGAYRDPVAVMTAVFR